MGDLMSLFFAVFRNINKIFSEVNTHFHSAQYNILIEKSLCKASVLH